MLVIKETRDSDFPDPAKEAQHVANLLRGSVAMIEGAGHYPQPTQGALTTFMGRRPGLDERVLIGEAAVLADRHGLDFVTMANLAARFNVCVQSLYNHIESADHL